MKLSTVGHPSAPFLNDADAFTQRRNLAEDLKLIYGSERGEFRTHLSAESVHIRHERVVFDFHLTAQGVVLQVNLLARAILLRLIRFQVWSDQIVDRLPQAAHQICHDRILFPA